MVLYLLLGAGMTLTNTWASAAAAVPNSAEPAIDALDISASAVLLLMICWNTPKLAASMLGGAPSFTGGDAVATAGAVAQGAMLVTAAAAGGVALGAKVLAARGGATGVGQAASIGAGGAGSAGGFGGGSGLSGSAGASSPSNGGAPRSGGGSGGAVIGSSASNGQVSPPSVASSASGPAAGGESGSAQQNGNSSNTSTSAPQSERSAGPNQETASASPPQVSPPSSNRTPNVRPGSTNQVSEATTRVSRKLAVGTQFVRMARSAVPPDNAPHNAPPALRSEGEE